MRHAGKKERFSKDMSFAGNCEGFGVLGLEPRYGCPKVFADTGGGGGGCFPATVGLPPIIRVCDLRQITDQNRERVEVKGEAVLGDPSKQGRGK